MSELRAGPPQDDAELRAYGAVAQQVYNVTNDDHLRMWLEASGAPNIRVVRDGAKVVGGLVLIPMGQWFGGRAVPMTGVAAVAVAPEHRGRRAATELMRAAVREMHAAGTPISALYPATQPLYRSVGYECAGIEYRTEMQADGFRGGDRELGVRAATEQDDSAIDECYRRRARLSCGHLERVPYIWRRIRRPRTGKTHGFVVDGPSGVEGYVFYSVREVTTGHKDFALWCQDLCSLTPAATRRIAAFLADHLSMTGEFAWRGSPSEPIHAVLREQHAVTIKAWNTWMLRVLDVGAALTQRGFAPGVAGEVHLDVAEDDLVPGNAGRWILRIEGGRAEATRGGRGTFRTNVRGLAALYTGFHSPADLRAAGHADADDATVAAASALFAGPAPWMADHF